MCLAVPAQIISVAGDLAVLDIAGVRITGNVALIEDAAPGDWVIMHTGVALARIDAAAAAATLDLLRELPEAVG